MAAMASSQIASVTLASPGVPGSSAAGSVTLAPCALTEQERFELEQCQRIVQLRDDVLAGNHPRIKLPQQLVAQKPPIPILLSAATVYGTPQKRSAKTNFQSSRANAAIAMPTSVAPPSAPKAAPTAPSASRSTAPSKPEINPIFLEKSDSLIRAELGLRRQKLERALLDEIEKKKTKPHAAQAEAPPDDVDVSDVFAKAVALVQASTAPSAAANGNAANAEGERESSFDENDYYSSRHDTPESQDSLGSTASRAEQVDASSATRDVPQVGGLQPAAAPHNASAQVELPPLPAAPRNEPLPAQTTSLPPPPIASVKHPAPLHNGPSFTPGSTNTGADEVSAQVGQGARAAFRLPSIPSPLESGEATQSDNSARAHVGLSQGSRSPDQHNRVYVTTQRPQPRVIRSHNLTPVAPQPAHVSPLIAPGRPPVAPAIVSDYPDAPRGAPAQVAALRSDHQGGSSPDSSSPRGQGPDKKRGKKKNKRKADRLVQDTAPEPYIKTEPRSPSPLSAPATIRPAKRRKQAQVSDAAAYGDGQQRGPSRQEFYPVPDQQQRGERVLTVQPAHDGLYQQIPGGGSDAAMLSRSYDRVYYEDARSAAPLTPSQYRDPGQEYAPRGYAVQYADDGYRPVRSTSHALPPRPQQEYSGYYDVDYSRLQQDPAAMGPPRQPVARVVVDAYGREYYEPQQPPAMRQSVAPTVRPQDPDIIYEGTAPIRHSVAPQMRPRDPEIIYERTAPIRAMSRRPGPEPFDDSDVIYQRVSPPPYRAARRVVTQPAAGHLDGLEYPPRPYSVRPVGPPVDDYVPAQELSERRPVEAAQRQYIARAASVRPLEPARYEVPVEGRGRLQSARPDGGHGEYGGMAPPTMTREYGPRPLDARGVQRAYSVRPAERYYGQPLMEQDDVTYVERPQGQPGVVYETEPRRDVYR